MFRIAFTMGADSKASRQSPIQAARMNSNMRTQLRAANSFSKRGAGTRFDIRRSLRAPVGWSDPMPCAGSLSADEARGHPI